MTPRSNDFLVEPLVAPQLSIPDSTETVHVRLIDTNVKAEFTGDVTSFLTPATPGFSTLDFPIFTFLISHPRTGRHVLFDNGIRRDWENMAPRVLAMTRTFLRIDHADDPAGILDAEAAAAAAKAKEEEEEEETVGGGGQGGGGTDVVGVSSRDVEAVIWSHTHFDHTGDMARFPASTALVVGPGVRAESWPGYPTRPDAATLDSDAEGREVREIDFSSSSPLTVAGFRAHDFFGDGSFYLLDAPGHATGHMCALARVASSSADSSSSSSPSSSSDHFVFLGADACHHPGVLRPSPYLPLPRQIDTTTTTTTSHHHAPLCCPGDRIRALLAHGRADRPVFELPAAMCADRGAARDTVRRIQALDADGRVLVVLAHDGSLLDFVETFPRTLNGWWRRDRERRRGNKKEEEEDDGGATESDEGGGGGGGGGGDGGHRRRWAFFRGCGEFV